MYECTHLEELQKQGFPLEFLKNLDIGSFYAMNCTFDGNAGYMVMQVSSTGHLTTESFMSDICADTEVLTAEEYDRIRKEACQIR